MNISLQDKLACAQRELNIRRRVYPNRVMTHRMSQAAADREVAIMAAIVADYAQQIEEAARKAEHERKASDLFNRAQVFQFPRSGK